jgi:hypothetical protein
MHKVITLFFYITFEENQNRNIHYTLHLETFGYGHKSQVLLRPGLSVMTHTNILGLNRIKLIIIKVFKITYKFSDTKTENWF